MVTSILHGTCSMLHLGCINWENDFEANTKKGLELKIIEQFIKDNSSENYTSTKDHYKPIRQIIYNTNHGFLDRLWLWWNHGFKTKYSYEGNNDRVYVMFKEVNKRKR